MISEILDNEYYALVDLDVLAITELQLTKHEVTDLKEDLKTSSIHQLVILSETYIKEFVKDYLGEIKDLLDNRKLAKDVLVDLVDLAPNNITDEELEEFMNKRYYDYILENLDDLVDFLDDISYKKVFNHEKVLIFVI